MESVPSLEACRVCANFYVTSGEVDLLHLFDTTQPLQKELVFITSELKAWQLNISCNDGLPQRICGNCFTRFCGIYSFRAECLEAQEKLLQAFVEGDCAEEIVTAQETALNGLLPTDLQLGNEEIVGLESMLVEGGHIDDPLLYTDPTVRPKAELKSEVAGCNELLQLPTLPNPSQQVTPETGFTNGTENIIKHETMKQEIPTLIPEDLEEVLQGNYIPKQIRNQKVEVNHNYGNDDISYPSDASSSFEEEDSTPQSDTSQNTLSCQYCYDSQNQPKTFASDEALSQHFFDAHDPTSPYTCPECPQKFVNAKLRGLHVKQKHQRQYQQTQQRERVCQFCCKSLRGITREEHMEQCQYIGDWECHDCGLKFTQVTHNTFRSHVQREHSSVKKQLRCNDCGRVFTQRTLWENHLTLHEKNTLLWCNECKEAFADAYELKKHKYKMHNGELPVHCDYCKKGFVTYPFLRRHLQHFHPDKLNGGTNAEMTCRNCGTEFTSMHKLRNHQQKPLDENGRCATSSHMQRKPGRVGIFPCPFCSRRFHVKAQLEKHLRSHDALKRTHKCDLCHVMFRSPFELKQHQDIAHYQIKAYVCEQCGKKFAYKKDLREHMVYHEEQNKLCSEPGCGYCCKNDKVLNEHIRQKHRLFPCDYCNQTFTHHRLTQHMQNVHNIQMDTAAPYTDVGGGAVGNVVDEVVGDVVDSVLGDVAGDVAADVESAQDKVIVEFVGNRPLNDINLQDQLGQYPITEGSIYNPFEDYAAEMVVEQEHDIVVT